MPLLVWFHRWRLAETTYWLPYEHQIHSVMVSDPRLKPVREVLSDQFANLYRAYRSRNTSEVAATYSYQSSLFYDVTDEFTLCKIHASNAEGVIRFGGGMLSEIRLTPNVIVTDPSKFKLEDLNITNIYIPPIVQPPAATGWIAELESEGLIRRHGAPRKPEEPSVDSRAHLQYRELFEQCADAEFVCGSESFHFLRPEDTCVVQGNQIDAWVPILDLREFGGLAITTDNRGFASLSLVTGGVIAWSEPDLVRALRRIKQDLRE